MYQSNEQISRAFLAAIEKLENSPLYWKLRNTLSVPLGQRRVYQVGAGKCGCKDKAIGLPFSSLYPIFPSHGRVTQGLYSVLPFYYVVTQHPSKMNPLIEVVEVPLVHTSLCLSEVEKEVIEESFASLGKVHIASSKKITQSNIQEELFSIRKNILSKVFNVAPLDSTIFFSHFNALPDSSFFLSDNYYINSLPIAHENIPWSFQSKRVLPVKKNQNVFCFTLNCWALNKHEV